MNAFNDLRQQARDKRDKAIGQARADYAASLVRIAELEQDLLGRDPPAHKSIASCIDRLIPADETFTTVDLMAALEALDPSRNWRKRSLDSHISRLRERGIVRRLKRATIHEPAVYARVGVAVEPLPFEGQTLPMVVREVLEARQPLQQTELVVAMLEAGYSTTMTPKALRDAVGVVLRKGGYSKRGDRWLAS